MADNVQLASGALVVATKGDGGNVQHQEVVAEFLSGGAVPIQVGIGQPFPTKDDYQLELLTSILVELRVTNTLLYALTNTEVEALEDLRTRYQSYAVTP